VSERIFGEFSYEISAEPLVRHLLETKNGTGYTAFHRAVVFGMLDVAKELCEKEHCNIETTDSVLDTPLHSCGTQSIYLFLLFTNAIHSFNLFLTSNLQFIYCFNSLILSNSINSFYILVNVTMDIYVMYSRAASLRGVAVFSGGEEAEVELQESTRLDSFTQRSAYRKTCFCGEDHLMGSFAAL
jgi:hypothetical protein